MANKPLKSIKYPGLPDTYTFVQIGTEAGQAADAAETGRQFTDLKRDLSHVNYQFSSINGVILPPSFEIGTRALDSNNQEIWQNYVKRMSFKRGTYISLKAGDTVARDSSVIQVFGGGYSTDGGATFIGISSQTSYTAPSDGIYFFWLRKVNDADFTDADLENGWKYIAFHRAGNMGESVAGHGDGVSMSAHDFSLVEQGKQTFFGYGNFEHYGLDVNGDFLLTQKYRVSNTNRMSFDRDLKIAVASGFKCGYVKFVDDNAVWVGWYQTSFNIPAGTIFNLQIARVTEDNTEIADVVEYVNAVAFVSRYENQTNSVNGKVNAVVNSASAIFTNSPLPVIWEQGEVTVDGESDTDARIRTKYIFVKLYESVSIARKTSPYVYYYITYDDDYNIVGYIGTIGYPSTITIKGTAISYIRVVGRNNGNIVPSEGENYIITGQTALTNVYRMSDRIPVIENIFRFDRYFSHIGVSKSSNIIIPSQSLADVIKTKRLGFKVLEINVHKTSDDNYICLHGSGGKFGVQFVGTDGTSVTDTPISSVTMDWIKANVRYVSKYDKYKTAPPSLEEMLQECKAQNIIPLIQYVDATEVEILNKIMGKNNYILNIYGNNRGVISDAVLMSWTSIADPIEAVAKCQASGKTYFLGVDCSNSVFSEFTDSDWKNYIEAIHNAGYFVGGAYMTETVKQKMFGMGWDAYASTYPINEIESGNLCNLFADVSYDDFTTNGTVSDGVLTLSTGNTITPNATLPSVFLGGGSLHIRFNGSISVSFGGVSGTFTSDGTKDVWFSSFFEEAAPTFTITATSETEVYDISYKASKM